MNGRVGRFCAACLLLAVATAMGGCTVGHLLGDDSGKADDPRNPRPVNYKPDIVATLRVYLNNPLEITDASVSEPLLQSIGGYDRYVVCVRLNAKKSDGQFTGAKEYVAVFVNGRLDRMIDAKPEQCSTAQYQPFPEAQARAR